MPLRNVPFGAGVNTTPSLPMKIFAVASSATLPSRSSTTQLPKPRAFASSSARALQIEVGGNAFEGARTVEYRGAQPGGMVAHAHDRHISFAPIAFVVGPG